MHRGIVVLLRDLGLRTGCVAIAMVYMRRANVAARTYNKYYWAQENTLKCENKYLNVNIDLR